MFAASAYGAGGGAVKLSKDGNGGIKAEEVWFSRNMENHHGGVLVIDDALYGANGGNGGGYLACLDFKTGDVLWNERAVCLADELRVSAAETEAENAGEPAGKEDFHGGDQ